MPVVTGPIGRGNLQYTAMWKAAQRFTRKPVKWGAVSAEIVAFAVQDKHYKSVPERMFALADAFNQEYHELADAGCPVIQIEEPQIPSDRGAQHPGCGDQSKADGRGVQPHRQRPACQDRGVGTLVLGQPLAATHVRVGADLQAALEAYNTVDATSSLSNRRAPAASTSRRSARPSPTRNLDRRDRSPHAAGRESRAGGVANPRRAQAHPGRAADDIDRLRHGPRGHEPPARVLQDGVAHARHHIVRKELGAPEATVLAADERYSLVVPVK